jgi:thiol-disulfide isomerase/thioredoxin
MKLKLKMIKKISLVGLMAFATFAHAHDPIKTSSETEIVLKCVFDNCSAVDVLNLYESDGLFKKKIKSAVPENGSFTFSVPKTATPQFYFVGMNEDVEKLKPVLLGTEKETILSGPCYNMTLTSVQGSKVNEDFDKAIKRVNQLKIESNKISQNYQLNYSNAALKTDIEGQMLANDKAKVALLDSLKKTNPFLSKIVASDTYTSFLHSPKKGNFKDEIEYFATQYFQYADLKDADYSKIPYLFDMFRNYAQVISLPALQLNKSQQKTYFYTLLNKIPAKSTAYKYALTGILTILVEKNNTLLIEFGDKYLTDFPNEEESRKSQLTTIINQAKSQMLDVPAPEIVMADTTGKMLKLSNLKGKVVLIDFWASWCGPCRRENPNVVKLYEEYKSKGFEVFSVSLDQDKERWIKAIKDDGLVWTNHVSDLKYWQNEAARLYQVSSIPRTILLDKEGNIIARDLRGPALEAKLKEVFGM